MPYWIYANQEWSNKTDLYLIVFLDKGYLSIDTEIGFLSGTVPKLLDIQYFCDYANSIKSG